MLYAPCFHVMHFLLQYYALLGVMHMCSMHVQCMCAVCVCSVRVQYAV